VGVGFAVGRGVGRGVGPSGGVVALGELGGRVFGVAVGTTATIGPWVGAADGAGSTDPLAEALGEALVPGSVVAVELDVGAGDPDGASAGDWAGWVGAGVPDAWATPLGGRSGATTPAVNATVARMRFRTPMATTRRAR
jgi:hypothetical protein